MIVVNRLASLAILVTIVSGDPCYSAEVGHEEAGIAMPQNQMGGMAWLFERDVLVMKKEGADRGAGVANGLGDVLAAPYSLWCRGIALVSSGYAAVLDVLIRDGELVQKGEN